MEKNVGFNARVEPLWYAFRKSSEEMKFLERWLRKRKIRRLVAQVDARLAKQGRSAPGWDQPTGKCVCNLRVARVGLPSQMQNYLPSKIDRKVLAGWKHLMAQREVNAIVIPVDFPDPFTVAFQGNDILITGSPRLKAELEELNERLRIDETFALAKMSRIDFIDADSKQISMYESKFATFADFWPNLTYVLLKKIADKSVESGLPVLFA
jgi:hypothetical protein